MNRIRLFILALPLMLIACSSTGGKDTIARLRHVQIEIKKEKIEGGIDKAMAGYQHFLKDTSDSTLTPEAIRRLADLKIEKEYGTFTPGSEPAEKTAARALPAPQSTTHPKNALVAKAPPDRVLAHVSVKNESEVDFERRATRSQPIPSTAAAKNGPVEGADDLERAGTLEAIALYKKLLDKYPLYDRNDQVLYQMSRAYAELGQIEKSMVVMNRLIREFPKSRYIDEVQFRRAEYFFTRRRYLDAEDAYKSIVKIGVASPFYELALYKLGWTFYKQELYEASLDPFIALLDYKVSKGYDFAQTKDEQERKRTEDTFRVISLSFSNLGGANSAVEYFSRHGKRSYEDDIYSNLGEFYFDKRRYADASATYNAFVSRNPFHKKAPSFQMRVIEIQSAGGFPSLVLDAKKKFAETYGLNAEYWKYFDPKDRPDVLDYLKTNLTDLANYYHACYQDPKQAKKKQASFKEALHWYREFLASFPKDTQSPAINYQLADLLVENHAFGEAAVEFEKTAYDYPTHEKSSQAGYAAVAAYREQLRTAAPEDKDEVRREAIRSSLKFADTFPKHEKAAIVLGAAADDLYDMKAYDRALAAANKLLEVFPDTDVDVIRSAWLVIGHSSYELKHYSDAETGYLKALALLPAKDKTRKDLVDNLAASIYKQGEQANAAQDYRAAADHFLRVGRMAPTSKIRPTAEYDAAAVLIKLKDWDQAAKVLVGFRKNFPGHPLQPEVTKKIAYVYKENKQLSLAAGEYERIEKESKDNEIRREALLIAAELHEKSGDSVHALAVYRRYVDYFPQPVDINLETRNKIAETLKTQGDRKSYLKELEQIVAIDASAGSARTPRTRYLAGNAALVLAENTYETFLAVKLVQPLKVNLQKKKGLMKKAIDRFNSLLDYESGELTAAATFYLAEIYAHFSKALMKSERPVLTFDYYKVKPGDTLSAIAKRSDCDVSRIARANNLNKSNYIVAGKKLKIPRGLYPLELEQYELALEDQAYPFEEKAIKVHQSNLALVTKGVYNEWVEKSLQKLAKLVPARYDKPEETTGIVSSLETYMYEIKRPVLAVPPKSKLPTSAQVEQPEAVTKVEPAAPAQAEKPGPARQPETPASEQVEQPGSVTKVEPATPAKVEESGAATAPEPGASGNIEEGESDTRPKPAVSEQVEQSGSVTTVEPAASENVKEAEPDAKAKLPAPAQVEKSGSATKIEAGAPIKTEGISDTEPKSPTPAQVQRTGSVTAPEHGASGRVEEAGPGTEANSPAPAQVEQPGSVTESKPPSARAEQPESVTETETVTETAAQTDYMNGTGKETQR